MNSLAVFIIWLFAIAVNLAFFYALCLIVKAVFGL